MRKEVIKDDTNIAAAVRKLLAQEVGKTAFRPGSGLAGG